MKDEHGCLRFRVFLMMFLLCGVMLAPRVHAEISGYKDRPLKDKVYGKPTESNSILFDQIDSYYLGFKLNNQEDRVGLFLEVCKDPTGMYNRNCQSILYYFPELSFDKKNAQILLGKEVVAKYSGSDESTVMQKPFAFGYEIEDKIIDDGFDKYNKKAVKVYLGKEINQK